MIEKQKIKKAIEEAYYEAGENAYFANGFHYGIKFIENEIEVLEQTISNLKEDISIKYGKIELIRKVANGRGDCVTKIGKIKDLLVR